MDSLVCSECVAVCCSVLQCVAVLGVCLLVCYVGLFGESLVQVFVACLQVCFVDLFWMSLLQVC